MEIKAVHCKLDLRVAFYCTCEWPYKRSNQLAHLKVSCLLCTEGVVGPKRKMLSGYIYIFGTWWLRIKNFFSITIGTVNEGSLWREREAHIAQWGERRLAEVRLPPLNWRMAPHLYRQGECHIPTGQRADNRRGNHLGKERKKGERVRESMKSIC